MTIKFEARMEENERCLVAVHHLEEALDKDLHDSVIESQNKNLTDEQIHNILDDLRLATERFTEAENKQQETSTNNEILGGTVVDTKSLRSGGSRQSETRDTIFNKFTPLTLRQKHDKYPKIYPKIYPKMYPSLSPNPPQTEAYEGHPVCPINSMFFPKRLADMELKTKSTLWQLNRIHEHKSNKIVALERIEASIKKNMRRL